MQHLFDYIHDILKHTHLNPKGNLIGLSKNGLKVYGYKLGEGAKNISLIAGNHADEPVGPLLLKKLVNFLTALPENHFLLKEFSWYIIPHNNPDAEKINQAWYTYEDEKADLYKYLKFAQRELPGDDVEFGFPIESEFESLRPENENAYQFWKSAKQAFDLHVSLHGMKAAYGAWFLIDEDWVGSTQQLQNQCAAKTQELGYQLFDLNRFGEKGFKRINKGFCTRPSGKYMRAHFNDLNDAETAHKFHASSMESIRSLGGDCLTLVTEMPLFLYPHKKRKLTWPDAHISRYSKLFSTWQLQVQTNQMSPEDLILEMEKHAIFSMSWQHQMQLQWQLICSGLACVVLNRP